MDVERFFSMVLDVKYHDLLFDAEWPINNIYGALKQLDVEDCEDIAVQEHASSGVMND